MLVSANKELYVSLPKRQKMLLSKSIVNAVRSQQPPGRFLQKDPKTELWYDVGDHRATEKTSQALREGAPEIRNKMKSQQGKATNGQSTIATPASAPLTSSFGEGNVAASIVSGDDAALHSTSFSSAGSQPQPVVVGGSMYPPTSPAMGMPPATPAPVEPQGPVPTRKRNSQTSKGKSGLLRGSAGSNTQFDSADIAPPTAGLDADQQFSFGSIAMTDMEQARLMNGFSMGSTMSYANQPQEQDGSIQQQQQQQQHLAAGQEDPRVHFAAEHPKVLHTDGAVVAPVDGGLEPAGLSFGSVMSISTDAKLEDGGLSFGSMMSFVKEGGAPEAVDGGLEAIGTSFGSLSLATNDRHNLLLETLKEETEVASVEAAPTFLQQQKSKGSLLDCSDTDSDDEQESAQAASAQKSADWERLKATVEAQNYGPHVTAATAPSFPGAKPATLDIPTTTFDRDFSQMSAISVGDDFAGFGDQVVPAGGDPAVTDDVFDMPPPPAAIKKQESDNWEHADQIEYAYLNRGPSLGEEFASKT